MESESFFLLVFSSSFITLTTIFYTVKIFSKITFHQNNCSSYKHNFKGDTQSTLNVVAFRQGEQQKLEKSEKCLNQL